MGLGPFEGVRRLLAPKAEHEPPFLLGLRSSTAFIIGTVCLAVFTDIFLYGLVIPVLPFALTSRAGVAAEHAQSWNAILLACYSIALFVGSPVVGFYADRSSSRRLPLMLGLLALAAATLLLCLGRSVAVFVVGRLLQGASAAVVWSVGLALLADTVGQRIGLAMGCVGISLSAGLLLAPLVGGAVYSGAGYYAVYYVAFGLIWLDVMLRLLLVEKKVARLWGAAEEGAEVEEADVEVGVEAEATTRDEAVNAEAEATTRDEAVNAEAEATTRDEAVNAEAGLAHAGAEAEAVVDAETGSGPGCGNSTPAPLSSFRRVLLLLRSRRLLAALAGTVLQAGILTAFDTVLPLFVRTRFDWSSTAAGLLLFAPYTPPLVLSPLIGLVADRWGARWPALAGFAASVPLLACLRFVRHNTFANKALLVVLLVILGVMCTLANVPLMAEISFAIEDVDRQHPGAWGPQGIFGFGYGLYTMAFALGSAAGSLMSGYVESDYGWNTTTWVLAVWCAAGVIISVFWVGEPRLGRLKEEDRAAGEGRGSGGTGQDQELCVMEPARGQEQEAAQEGEDTAALDSALAAAREQRDPSGLGPALEKKPTRASLETAQTRE